jgi:hypothetical protein
VLIEKVTIPAKAGKFVPSPMRRVSAENEGSGDVSTIELMRFESRILPPPAAFRSVIACRSEPGPESAVVVT